MLRKNTTNFAFHYAATAVLALCGCTMIPDYENPADTYARPKLDTAEFKHAAGLWKNAAFKFGGWCDVLALELNLK